MKSVKGKAIAKRKKTNVEGEDAVPKKKVKKLSTKPNQKPYTKEGGDNAAEKKKVKKFVGKTKPKNLKPGLKGKAAVSKTPLKKDTAQSRKERKLYRKKQNPNYELSHNAKKIWEKLRVQRTQLSKDEKSKLVKELMGVVQENDKKLIDLCYAHDTSRVIQTCLKQGSRDQRQKLFVELKMHALDLCKSMYGKNVIWKMLKYGTPPERSEILSKFEGFAYPLIKNKISASVLEYAYNNYANSKERDVLVKQLYGKVFRFYKDKTLEEVLKEEPEKKESILNSFKSSLEALVEKEAMKHTLVHKAFYDFFLYCDDVMIRSELIELMRESLVHMMHTHDGAHVTMKCIWYGTKKDRKIILKTMKEFAIKLSCEEYGHLPLLAAFDCVDDTVFLKKALIQPLIKGLNSLAYNKYGRKVLIYLMSPRNPSHFLPETVKLLSTGDNNLNSKKPMDQRHRELLEAASSGIVDYVAANMKELVFDRTMFVLIETAYQRCCGDKAAMINPIINLLKMDFKPNEIDENGNMHIIEDQSGHMVVKRLIAGESKLKSEDSTAELKFSNAVLEMVPGEALASWSACNRGSQILLGLVESKDEQLSASAKKALKNHIDTINNNSSVKSTKILLQKLA